MMLSNGSFFYIKYNKFRISDEYAQYALVNAEEFSGNSSCVATSCPIEMVHESCNCETSCSDPIGMTDCREICVETCVPKGCFVSETNSFILEGDFYSDTGCTKMCSCSNGQLTCDYSYRCDVNAVCERRSDHHQCYCNAGFSGNGVSCRSICDPHEVYGTCTCQKSCANPGDCVSCTGVQGCFCPDGFYLQGEDCVRQQDCRCFIDGIIIPEGQSYSDSTCTKRCSCNNGQRTCDNNYQCDVNAVCERRSTYHKCYCNAGYSGDGVTCQSICRTNEVYGTCSCQKSCTEPAGCVSCTGGQGCYCPDGFYLQGGDCVRRDQCGCYIDGNILLDGETYVNSGCTRRCTCTNNRLNCDNHYRCSSNAACRVRNGARQCYCNSGYEGDGRTCTRIYTDCNDVRNAGNTRSDVYSIRPAGYGSSFDVFCNMDIDGGGWTVFQRRINGATDFYRNWASYKNGFGNIRQEFWLGNEKLYYLTQQATYEYRMDFVYSSRSYHHKYSRFRINNESNKYRVTDVGTRSGTRGYSLYNTQNIAFSTYDRDNDGQSSTDCAEGHRSGWWHGGYYYSYSYSWCHHYPEGSRHRICSHANPNGDYDGGNGKNIYDHDYYYH
ncbi:Ficolin-1 [Holothuria leucospilota]|uniref:Ficolin-1 n=1 Tax=Holothuria leucospilota TaxID=206669 RepID=A0A9Q1BWV6_HOLLE|nr:Ficolin-1 [Holothuria leucospilota]